MKDKLILEKMLKYIDELEQFIKDYTIESFETDRKTINACVFNLSQIGELAGKISEETVNSYPNIEWRGLKSLRNKIVHDYDGVNLNMIWGFLSTELQSLRLDIQAIFNNM